MAATSAGVRPRSAAKPAASPSRSAARAEASARAAAPRRARGRARPGDRQRAREAAGRVLEVDRDAALGRDEARGRERDLAGRVVDGVVGGLAAREALAVERDALGAGHDDDERLAVAGPARGTAPARPRRATRSWLRNVPRVALADASDAAAGDEPGRGKRRLDERALHLPRDRRERRPGQRQVDVAQAHARLPRRRPRRRRGRGPRAASSCPRAGSACSRR